MSLPAAFTAQALARGEQRGVARAARRGLTDAEIAGALVVAGVALVAALRPSLGYDATWHLAWGRELVAGRRPAGGALAAPTAHPLLLALSALLAPLGAGGATAVLTVVTGAAVGATAAAVRVAARGLGLAPAAALAAGLLVATSPAELRTASFLGSDPLVLALAATGAAALMSHRRRSAPALLVACALLRPEGWLLLLAATLRPGRRPNPGVATTLLLPPLAWAATGLLVAGDPVHAFSGTRALADALHRPQGLGAAVAAFGPGLLAAAGPAVAVAGLVAGAVLLLHAPGDARGRLLAPLGLGALAWLALGVTGLPLVQRYLALPAASLAVIACAAVAPRRSVILVPLAVAVAAAGLAGLHGTAAAREDQRAIALLLRALPQRAAACPVSVTEARLIPDVALRGGRPLRDVRLGGDGVVIAPTEQTHRSAVLTARVSASRRPTLAAAPGFVARGSC